MEFEIKIEESENEVIEIEDFEDENKKGEKS